MCFQWSREERTGVFGVPAAHNLVKKFGEVLFSILAVEEQIPYRNLRTLFPAFDGFQTLLLPMTSQPEMHHTLRILSFPRIP